MTQNRKPNELPRDVTELPQMTAPLILDNRLSRQGVIDEIVDITDIPLSTDPSGGSFTHSELAALYKHLSDDRDRYDWSTDDRPKFIIIRDLAQMFGFAADGHQSVLTKSQLVHILLTLAHDDKPDPFTLPSDPDPPGVTPNGAD